MKPRKMDEKLKRLAESMKDLSIEGTTRITWSCLTEREKLLYDKTELIAQKPFYNTKPSDSARYVIDMNSYKLFRKRKRVRSIGSLRWPQAAAVPSNLERDWS